MLRGKVVKDQTDVIYELERICKAVHESFENRIQIEEMYQATIDVFKKREWFNDDDEEEKLKKK